jgi:hypothetical protein
MAALTPPDDLVDLARRLRHRADRLDDVAHRLSRDLDQLRRPLPGRDVAPWEGRLAAEFDAHGTRRLSHLDRAAREMRGAAMIAEEVADDQRVERRRLLELEHRVDAALRAGRADLPFPRPDRYDPKWREAARAVGVEP